MKTIFASALLATTLVSASAFASPETSHNGIEVIRTTAQPSVSANAQAGDQLASYTGKVDVQAGATDPARNANTSK